MDRDIDKLIRITGDMAAAFEQDDMETCASLLSERGNVLEVLSGRYGDESGVVPPSQLISTMATIRELDRVLESRLATALSETGLQISELQQKTRRDDGGSNSIYLNRRA